MQRGAKGRGRGRGYHAQVERQPASAGPATSRYEVLKGLLGAWSTADVAAVCCAENAAWLDADLSSLACHWAAKAGAQPSAWGPAEAWEPLLRRLAATASEATMTQVSKAIWGLARMPASISQNSTFLDALVALQKQVESLAEEFDIKGVVNVLHSFGTLRVSLGASWRPRRRTLQALARRGVTSAEAFGARDVVNSLWAAARLGDAASLGDFCGRLLGRALAVLRDANEQEISNCFWAVATLHAADTHQSLALPSGLLQELCDTALGHIKSFNAQIVSNILWALGKLPRRGNSGAQHRSLLVALESQAAAQTQSLTVQGLTNVLWGLAKAGASFSSESAAALLKACAHHAQSLDGKDASNTLWSLSMLLTQQVAQTIEQAPGDVDPTSLAADKLSVVSRAAVAAVCTQVEKLADTLTDCDVASSLLAIAKLHEIHLVSKYETLVGRLCVRGAKVAGSMRPAQAVWTLWSLAKLGRSWKSDEAVASALHDLIMAALPQLPDQEFGVAAWSLAACGTPPNRTGADIISRVWRASKMRLAATLEDGAVSGGPFGWRTIGHLLFAERRLSGCVKPHRKVCIAALCAANRYASLTRKSVERAAASAAAPYIQKLVAQGGSSVLVVDDELETRMCDSAWHSLLSSAAYVHHWRRFAACDDDAEVWPSSVAATKFDLCIFRLHFHAGAVRFAMAAAASSLRKNGSILVWVDGSAPGALQAARATLAEISSDNIEVLAEGSSAVVMVARCKQGNAKREVSFQSWRQQVNIQLPLGTDLAPLRKTWCTYPGLFAGGGLDVMTAALLNVMPSPAPGAKILDYACGSGAIAAALIQRTQNCEVSLLDADAVAVEACRENVVGAKRILNSDGWRALTHRKLRFDWIVSNPPVHQGRLDDFRVLMDLVDGAGPRLRPNGVLWIVAQDCRVGTISI